MANYPQKRFRIPWWLIIVFFLLIWPVGLALLVVRLLQNNGVIHGRNGQQNQSGRQGQNANPYDYQFGGQEYDYRYNDDASRQEAEEWNRNMSRKVQKGMDQANRVIRNVGAKVGWSPDNQAYDYQFGGQEYDYHYSKNTASRSRTQNAPTGAGDVVVQRTEQLSRLHSGQALIVWGAILFIIFALSCIVIFSNNLVYLGYSPLWLVGRILPSFFLAGVGAGLFAWGQVRKNQLKRCRRMIQLIGTRDQVPVGALASAYPTALETVRSTLKYMIDQNLLGPRAYLDYARDLLLLSGPGVQAEPVQEEASAPKEQKEQKAQKEEKEEKPDQEDDNEILKEIRKVNDAIRNPELSRKIDRIEEITGRILEYQDAHPDRASETRKFLNYYLPTTLRILTSYGELEKQGVEGKNITATKKRIEDMMDMVVEGFERQLDNLFAGDMMDIAADITVMEKMMQGDGLFQSSESVFSPQSGKTNSR